MDIYAGLRSTIRREWFVSMRISQSEPDPIIPTSSESAIKDTVRFWQTRSIIEHALERPDSQLWGGGEKNVIYYDITRRIWQPVFY